MAIEPFQLPDAVIPNIEIVDLRLDFGRLDGVGIVAVGRSSWQGVHA